MPTALVLSGGGTRGDFQVGAVRFLYDQGIRPDLICGASVGAINGTKLAEGEPEGGADPGQGLSGLESLWLGMRTNSVMYLPEPWLETIDPRLRAFLTGTRGDTGISPPRTDFSEWGELGSLMAKVSELGWVTTDGAAVLRMLQAMMAARALYNLSPIVEKMRASLDLGKVQAWSRAGRTLRLATVCLESGLLRYVTEDGMLLERDNATPVRGMPPECRVIADELRVVGQARRRAQDELRVARRPSRKRIALDAVREANARIGVLEDDLRECSVRQAASPAPLHVDLLDGALASASMPGIFLPVELGGETYVDGGVREIVPLQIALDQGADSVYVVMCAKGAPDWKGPFGSSSLLQIMGRALTALTIDEVKQHDVRLHSRSRGRDRADVTIVQPTLDLHGATTIDPGLISISMAYGYMRAADAVHGGPPDRGWEITDEIARTRSRIWRLECLAAGQPVPTDPKAEAGGPDPTLEPELSAARKQLAELLDERRQLGRALPEDADGWPLARERHPWHSEG